MRGKVEKLSPELVLVLVQIEREVGFELTIVSGQRDPEHNRLIGGVEQSEHTYQPFAQGADVLCKRSVTRYKLLKACFALNVTRIGIGSTFVHIGIAKDKPPEVVWHYYEDYLKKTTPVAEV